MLAKKTLLNSWFLYFNIEKIVFIFFNLVLLSPIIKKLWHLFF
ncbi:Uncharacterised protein [Canicola haemoglobinophilus]|uniref:Uncharacterized protein n=1 Tax=Canicola haemoglobinophilus TaxID=733 RepID=A0A377HTY9_9PAST|nr:Uncharacterised protein [Canicola haemoglobinophilus]